MFVPLFIFWSALKVVLVLVRIEATPIQLKDLYILFQICMFLYGLASNLTNTNTTF
jgi:hypothetical protein